MMRLLGALFAISSALAATAVAGPNHGRAGFMPRVEEASPAAEGTGVTNAAGLSGARLAPDPNATPRAGNPSWAIPLSALVATRDRPLFSASRRPPIVAVPIFAPPPQKDEALAPPLPERPSLTLVGTIISPKASVAVLQISNTDAISRLRVGEENDGWRVRVIDLRSIVVVKGAQSVKLVLPRPDGARAE